MPTLSMTKVHALERGEAVELTDAELEELMKWTPPYVSTDVKPIRPGVSLVSSFPEDE